MLPSGQVSEKDSSSGHFRNDPLVIVWHLLQHDCPYVDLGSTYFDERDRTATEQRLVHRLQQLGYSVHLTAASVYFRADLVTSLSSAASSDRASAAKCRTLAGGTPARSWAGSRSS